MAFQHFQQDMKRACKYGNINNIARCLNEKCFNVNEPTQPNGETYLMIAAQNGHFKAVIDLLEAGANMSIQAHNGETALHKASAFGFQKVVDVLLKRGADIKIKDVKGNTALHTVGSKLEAEEESIQTLGVLLKHFKAENIVDDQNNSGETALHIAATKDFSRHINKLLYAGACIHRVDCKGDTPLHKNVMNPQANALRNIFMLKMNAEDVRKDLLETKNMDGETPLQISAKMGHWHNFKILEDLGSEFYGSSPLHLAASNGHYEKIMELLEKEPNKKEVMLMKDKNQNTFLHAALRNKQDYVVRQIIEEMPHPLMSEVLNSFEEFPLLLLAVQLNNVEIFR